MLNKNEVPIGYCLDCRIFWYPGKLNRQHPVNGEEVDTIESILKSPYSRAAGKTTCPRCNSTGKAWVANSRVAFALLSWPILRLHEVKEYAD